MRLEIKSAANFLTNLVRIKSGTTAATTNNNNGGGMNIHQLELFGSKLEDMMCSHYQKHWFPEKPFKGSGYRCIRINHKMDPIIIKAGSECGFDEECLRGLFPDELTMWIDPKEVSYRIGENGSICVLFDGGAKSDSSPAVPSRTVTITVNRRASSNPSSNNSKPADSSKQHQSSSNILLYERMPLLPLSTCKDTIRSNGSWDNFVMDPRNMNLEQYTPYVSS